MSDPEWKGSGELRGGAVIVQNEYPIEYTVDDTDSGERLRIRFTEPCTEARAPKVLPPVAVQAFDLSVRADQDRVEDVIEGSLDTLTGCLSFGSRRPVEWKVGALQRQGSGKEKTPRTLIMVQQGRWNRPPVGLPAPSLTTICSALRDASSARGRKLVRAIRWLARSRQTADLVEQFSFLAMSLASTLRLLSDELDELEDATRESETLRRFAVDQVGVNEEDWKTVGELRHELFHGGLSEGPDSRRRLSGAIPILRRAVIAALQTLMELPGEIPISDPTDDLGVVTESAIFTPADPDGED